MQACIPFSELIPDAVVRVTSDEPPLIWVVDLVMAVTGKNRNDSNEVLRATNLDLFCKEKVLMKSQPGSGNSKTKLVSFQDALELIMILPGKAAKEIRKKAADILTRYFAGDASLVPEIQANAESAAPLNQMAREALGKRSAEQTELEQSTRIKRMQLENSELEMSIRAKYVETQTSFMEAYRSLCPGNVLDDRAQAMFRDSFLNMAFQADTQKSITNGVEPDTHSLLSMSELADRLGVRLDHGDKIKLGKIVKTWYKEEYNEDPPSALKFVNGHNTNVAAYPERDWPAINAMIAVYK